MRKGEKGEKGEKKKLKDIKIRVRQINLLIFLLNRRELQIDLIQIQSLGPLLYASNINYKITYFLID